MHSLQRENEELTSQIDALKTSLEEETESNKTLEIKSKDTEKAFKGLKLAERLKTTSLKARLENEANAKLELQSKIMKVETEMVTLRRKVSNNVFLSQPSQNCNYLTSIRLKMRQHALWV